MKAIKVSEEVYRLLNEEKRDGESFNDALERRLDVSDSYPTAEEIDRRIEEKLRELRQGRR